MSGDTKKPGNFFSEPTRRVSQPGAEQRPTDPLRDATRRADAPPQDQGKPRQGGLSSPATRLWRPGQQTTGTEADTTGTPAQTTADDYVVGWLVVIDGPGRGRSLPLGYGLNSIGRDAGQFVSLDFGDGEISRENHCSIAYDGKNRKFFIQHGGGRNLTYVGDTPVLSPQELSPDATIVVGSTTLRFVPFCGDAFDWADLEASGS